MKNIIYIILFLIPFNGVAQEFADKEYYLVDKLVLDDFTESDKQILENALKEYHSANNDSNRIKSLHDVLEGMMNISWTKYNEIVFQLATKNLAKEKEPSNLHFFKKSLAESLNNKGYIKMGKGIIPQALEFYLKALKLQEEIGEEGGAAVSMLNIGVIYDMQNESENSLKYYKKALKIQIKLKNQVGIGNALNNIGVIIEHKGEINKALSHYERSLEVRERINDKKGIANSLNNIGGIYRIKKKSREARNYYMKSLAIRKILADNRGISASYSNIGYTYLAENNEGKARLYGDSAIKVARTIGFPQSIKTSAQLLSFVYEKQGKGMKALEMYKLYVQMKDSINNEETQKATIRQQTQYEFEKAQIVKENKAKEVARVLAEATGRRDNLQYSLIFLGILLLFVAILMLGFIKVSPAVAEGLIFFAFLILFEFVLVFTEPYLEQYTNGEPMYNLLANSVLALLIFPVHSILERLLKKRIVK